MTIGQINKIIPFSSVDGPGNRTAIFLQGCNFNCSYCHNPETINKCINCGACIDVCPTTALKMDDGKVVWDKKKCCECDACIKRCNINSTPKVSYMSVDDIINELHNYMSFIQGITVSGGECTLQEEFLIELFKKAKALGLTCFIDSNGSKDFEKMKNLMDVCDYVMLDVKSWSKEIHNKFIEYSNDNVLKNLEYLARIGKLYEVRTVVVPELFNNEETVANVSKVIGQIDGNIRYKLIKFRNLGVRDDMKNINSPSNEYMNNLYNIANKNRCNNIIMV